MNGALVDVLRRYRELACSRGFYHHTVRVACSIRGAIYEGYSCGLKEPDIVKRITLSLDGQEVDVDGYRVRTKAVFIHGNRSKVEFRYGRNDERKELGDIIFILSVVYNGKKWFERYTISQCKKGVSSNSTCECHWDLTDDAQLYLLSKFPTFRGVEGIIPREYFTLYDHSRCLGSYILLHPLDECHFIGAPALKLLLGEKGRLHAADLTSLRECTSGCKVIIVLTGALQNPLNICCISDFGQIGTCFKLLVFEQSCFDVCGCIGGVLGNAHFAPDVFSFVNAYMRGCLGEPVHAFTVLNEPALVFLHKLLLAVKQKAKHIEQRDPRLASAIRDLVTEFFRYPYVHGESGGPPAGIEPSYDFDFEGGGLGIVYTVVELGE